MARLSPESEREKKNGALRAQFVRQHCLEWIKRHKPTLLDKFTEAALKKHPRIDNGKSEFKVDESLMNLE